MSANDYAPPVTITVTDEGGTITLKGLTYARFRPGLNIYEEINQATTAIADQYHKPVIAIAHSPEGTHTLIYTVEGEIYEADDATLKDAHLDPSDYPPLPSQAEGAPLDGQTHREPPHTPTPPEPESPHRDYLLPVPLILNETDAPALDAFTAHASPTMPPAQARRTKSKIVISGAILSIVIAASAATYSLVNTTSSPEAHQGQSVATTDSHPQSALAHRDESSQSGAQSARRTSQSPKPPQTQEPTPTPAPAPAPEPAQVEPEATPEPATTPPAPAPPPSPNPPPEPDYGITDLQTSVLTGGGNGIVHVTFYLSGHGDTQATITIAGRSATVTGTAPGSVGAIVTGVPVGTHAWTATADGLVNSGTITVY